MIPVCPVMVPALWCEPAPVPPPPPPAVVSSKPVRDVLVGGRNRIKPVTRRAAEQIIASFPQLRVVGGWRANGYGAPDHPRGWALDMMVPLRSELGDRIALWLMRRADKMRVGYIMWRQRIWNHAYGKHNSGEKPKPIRRWRWVADRGSVTANHLDHVHVTFVRATP